MNKKYIEIKNKIKKTAGVVIGDDTRTCVWLHAYTTEVMQTLILITGVSYTPNIQHISIHILHVKVE